MMFIMGSWYITPTLKVYDMGIIEYSHIRIGADSLDKPYPITADRLNGYTHFHIYTIDLLYFIVGDHFFDYQNVYGEVTGYNEGELVYVG